MALVSLLHLGDGLGQPETFAFEHAMAHREALGIMSPLTRFSVLPYLLDPMMSGRPAGKWQLNHQQAQNDALRNVPTKYAWQYIITTTIEPNPTPPPPTITVTTQTSPKVTYGLNIGQNLIDSDLGNLRQLTWWIFQNHMEHYIANQMVVPPPAPKPAPQTTFPFW